MSTLEGYSNPISSIAWSYDRSQLASSSTDKTIRIWDLATGKCILTLEGHSSLISPITWSQSESRLASASYDNTVKIWHVSCPDFLRFDEVNLCHLHTSRGTFDVGCTGFVKPIIYNSTFSSKRHKYGF
jgi:WD40 repeat protein